MSDSPLFEKVLFENADKGFQYRLTLSEFKEIQYLHVRKYFLTYEGDWKPSNEGAAFPASIQNMYALLDGLVYLCSKEESIDSVKEHFKEILK